MKLAEVIEKYKSNSPKDNIDICNKYFIYNLNVYK